MILVFPMNIFQSKVFQSAAVAPAAIATMVAGSPLFVVTLAQPAAAQQRICVMDEDRGEVYCGRPASRDEIRRANRGNGRFGRNRGIYGQGDDRDYDDRTYDGRYGNDDDYRVRNTLNALYQDVLGRSIDRSGLKTYGRRLDNGWSLSRVRKDLANSDEARDRLNDIYRRVLSRDIDSDGLRTYRRRLADDWTLYDVEESVSKSDEARSRKRR